MKSGAGLATVGCSLMACSLSAAVTTQYEKSLSDVAAVHRYCPALHSTAQHSTRTRDIPIGRTYWYLPGRHCHCHCHKRLPPARKPSHPHCHAASASVHRARTPLPHATRRRCERHAVSRKQLRLSGRVSGLTYTYATEIDVSCHMGGLPWVGSRR
jgi:hypothetical protein